MILRRSCAVGILRLLGDRTFALDRMDVKQRWARQILDILQRIHQLGQIVTVDRAEVTESHFLEHNPGYQHALETFLEPAHRPSQVLAHNGNRSRQTEDPFLDTLIKRIGRDPLTNLVIGRVRDDPRQVVGEAPTLGEIDIRLSFNITMMSLSEAPALFRPSNEMPLVNAPSPITATTLRFSPN